MTTKSDLIDRARALVPMLENLSLEMDQKRRLDDAVIAEFIKAQFLEILVPKSNGGLELDIDTMCAVTRIIAEASPSAAHVLVFYIGHSWVHCLFDAQAQQDVFGARPFTLSPGTIAPSYKLTPADGGLVVNGRASWGSGVNHADWVFGTGFVEGQDMANGPTLFFVPRDAVTVHDNWYVLGQRATGSNDITIENVFVPSHRTLPVAAIMNGDSPGADLQDNPLYSRPMMPVSLCEVMSVLVGALTGATKEFVRINLNRLSTYTGAKAAQRIAVQMRMGKALAQSELLNSLLDDFIATVAKPDTTEVRGVALRTALKAHSALIVDMVRDGINEMVRGAGADAMRDGTLLQRYFRDITFLSLHAFFDTDAATETYGRLLLGLPPQAAI